MKKPNKYLYRWIIQGRKNGRWHDLKAIKARKEAHEQLRQYLTGDYKDYNAYRLLGARRREDNPDYKPEYKES